MKAKGFQSPVRIAGYRLIPTIKAMVLTPKIMQKARLMIKMTKSQVGSLFFLTLGLSMGVRLSCLCVGTLNRTGGGSG